MLKYDSRKAFAGTGPLQWHNQLGTTCLAVNTGPNHLQEAVPCISVDEQYQDRIYHCKTYLAGTPGMGSRPVFQTGT